MSPGKRVSACQPPLNFQHPYLDNKLARRPQKRELGIVDLFVFKMFGCFTNDDLPPTSPHSSSTIYQTPANMAPASGTTVTTTTTTTTTTAAIPAPCTTTTTTTTTTNPNHTQSNSIPPSLPRRRSSSSSLAEALMEHHQNQQQQQQGHISNSSIGKQPRRRSLRPDVRGRRRHSSSVWPEKIPEATTRGAVERTIFVEQRAEERARKLEEERERAQRVATEQNSGSASLHGDSSNGNLMSSPSSLPMKDHDGVGSLSSIDRLFPFDRDARSDGEASDLQTGESGFSEEQGNGGATTSVAGRVSRLSAMFEQQ